MTEVAGHTSVSEGDKGARTLTAEGKAGYSSFGAHAEGGAHVMRLINDKTEGMEMDVKVLGASAGVKAGYIDGSLAAKVNAGVHLVDADVGAFRLKLGAGVSTGAQMKDNSVEAKVAGCGVTLGQKIGVSVFDNEFSIDLKKLGRFFGIGK
ncbi:hypothetical protein PLESTB_000380600 [Pleodorina starrii]|uniref:Uncharacterized protein n=1 Tax=Pleodorina starrii TaxID=330485 RepID=A0A9W6BER2_9CHLO|nr:hypothetical protein PLESTM_000014500 [Pleodorina starrii]GLC50450.1 hypothetical protein PLESTB_000380600 [Pleodorina starrii]GLC73313.1 hypothetical protein PLESTF_001359400 [Pleodorina starrii]